MHPFLVSALRSKQDPAEVFYQATPQQAAVSLEPRSAAELRVLMRETVRSGTSRRSFRNWTRTASFDGIEVGGKTGSLTGGEPLGKCDWFVGYIRYQDRRIAVAALTVNEEKWRVKSSYLASSFFSNYVRGVRSIERQTASLSRNSKPSETN